jgi:hypothetical protein
MDSLASIPRKPKAERLQDIVAVIRRQMSDLIVQCPDELHVGLLMNMNSLIEASVELGKEHGKLEIARSIMAMVNKEIDSATTDDTIA